jgi:hypothetical protein
MHSTIPGADNSDPDGSFPGEMIDFRPALRRRQAALDPTLPTGGIEQNKRDKW